MQGIILLTITLSLCLHCKSHPYPSLQNVEIIDVDGGSSKSDEHIIIEVSENYRKLSEKQKSSGHQASSQSSTSCGYEV